MKQNTQIICLIKFIDEEEKFPHGVEQGKKTFQKLMEYVDANPSIYIFGISLKNIQATDASFPRESVVSIARYYRGEKSFYLLDVEKPDLIDNWRYAASAKDQPLAIWLSQKNEFEIIGPDISSTTKDLVDYVYRHGATTTAKVAKDFDISVQNASTRLKKLCTQGYIIRSDNTAETGGIEFSYRAIK